MKSKTLPGLLALLSGMSILTAAILGTLAVPLSYEAEAHYFAIGAPLPFIAVLLAVIGVLCGIALLILLPKESLFGTPFSGRFWIALPGAACAIVSAVLLFGDSKDSFVMLTAILTLLSSAYILCAELSQKFTAIKNVTVYLGFVPVIGCALLNACYYFDTSVEMNAPFKVLLQTALLFSMLYFTGDIRFLLQRSHPRLYLFLSVCTLATALPIAPMTIIAYVLGYVTRVDYLAGAVFALGIALTVLLRVIHLLFAPIPEMVQNAGIEEAPEDMEYTENAEECNASDNNDDGTGSEEYADDTNEATTATEGEPQ